METHEKLNGKIGKRVQLVFKGNGTNDKKPYWKRRIKKNDEI
jgi:hypothetical protein